jgi:hypothetical protein
MSWKPFPKPAEAVRAIESITEGLADLQKRLVHLERPQKCHRASGPSPEVHVLDAPETLEAGRLS